MLVLFTFAWVEVEVVWFDTLVSDHQSVALYLHDVISWFRRSRRISTANAINTMRYQRASCFVSARFWRDCTAVTAFYLRTYANCQEQCQMHEGEEDHARPGWTTSRRGQDCPWKRQSEWQRTGINGESTSMVWPTLGSRTAKEQNRTCVLRLSGKYVRSQTTSFVVRANQSVNQSCLFRVVQVTKSLQDPLEVGNNLPGISDNVRERGLEQKCIQTPTEGWQRRGRCHAVR